MKIGKLANNVDPDEVAHFIKIYAVCPLDFQLWIWYGFNEKYFEILQT